MYDVILFPTDGSEGARTALDHAIDLAERHRATLDVLYAAGDPTAGEEDADGIVEDAAEVVRERGVEANTIVLEGAAHEKIVGYVADRGVDAIVMGTHGRRGLERYLLGSVTEKVLRTVDVPVLVVPLDDETDEIDS